MVTITITTYSSMPGRYKYSVAKDGKVIAVDGAAGHDASAAAATAMDIAMRHRGSYLILAPEKVMQFIPINLRSGSYEE